MSTIKLELTKEIDNFYGDICSDRTNYCHEGDIDKPFLCEDELTKIFPNIKDTQTIWLTVQKERPANRKGWFKAKRVKNWHIKHKGEKGNIFIHQPLASWIAKNGIEIGDWGWYAIEFK